MATLEEHIMCQQNTGIYMHKADKTSPNILIWRSLLQDRQDGQQNKSSVRIPRQRRAHTNEQRKNYDNFWHNSRRPTVLVFTKSKLKPKIITAQYAITELPLHKAHQYGRTCRYRRNTYTSPFKQKQLEG
jgi:hypothetical protein